MCMNFRRPTGSAASLVIVILLIFIVVVFIVFSKSRSPQSVIVKPEYSNELECWTKTDSWRDIVGCGELRSKTIIGLADIEENKNKLTLLQNQSISKFTNKYISNRYGFEISYPSNWKIDKYENEGVETARLVKTDTNGGPQTEIVIGTGQVYSSSGALCANKGCDYDAGSITLLDNYQTKLTKSYIFTSDSNGVPIDTEIENYRFSAPLKEILSHVDEKHHVYVTATFKNVDEANKILDILSTLK